MGKKIDVFRAAAGGNGSKISLKDEKAETEVVVGTKTSKKKTKVLAIEVMVEDLPKFDMAMIKLSSRDNTLYKRKDIYIAMTKYFFDAIDKNIDKIKMEKY
ncbi:MAG: hypothetical protein FWF51_04450 [Chitinivibrionia bacterium]|nr:hypothetical protein [Chitinivibrionia bacterium]